MSDTGRERTDIPILTLDWKEYPARGGDFPLPWTQLVGHHFATPELADADGLKWCASYERGAPSARTARCIGVVKNDDGTYTAVVNYFHSNT